MIWLVQIYNWHLWAIHCKFIIVVSQTMLRQDISEIKSDVSGFNVVWKGRTEKRTLYAVLTVHLHSDGSTYGLTDVVIGSLTGVNCMQVTSLQFGHDQLIMLHFAWVSILLIRAVHKQGVTPPPYCGQRSTCNTNATKYTSFIVKRQLLMFHLTHN